MSEVEAKPSLTPELKCMDFDESYRFYTDVLGFSVLYTREEEGFAMFEYQGSDLMIDSLQVCDRFVAGAMEKPFGRGMSLQIRTDNVDALYQQVRDTGWKIFLDMEEKWYRANDVELGNRQFLVQDPDGYVLRFYEDLGERPCAA